MFEIRILLIIILLGLSIYYIYKMYAFNSHILSKATETIVDNMEDKFEDLDEKLADIDTKLQSIEDLINVRLEVCYKKVNDIYSLQNKVNEITKMNNQSIIHQINQYDEEIEDIDANKQNMIFNSVETSLSPQSKMNKLNNKCFIKHTNSKNQDREMFYMSSINKNDIYSKDKTKTEPNDISETSTEPKPIKAQVIYKNNKSLNSATSKSSKSSETSESEKSKSELPNEQSINNTSNNNNIFSNLYKNNKKSNLKIVKDNISLENESNLEQFINSLPENIVDNFFQKNKDNSSVILEMNGDAVKPYEVESLSPKFANAMKILNETNIIKNNSYNKLNELNKKNTTQTDKNNNSSLKNENNTYDNNSNNNDDIDNTSSNTETSSGDNSNEFENNIDIDDNTFIYTNFTQKTINKNKIVELN